MKRLLNIILFFCFYSITHGQISLSSLISAPLGNLFEKDATIWKKSIKQNYVLYYYKDADCYELEFEDVPVDNFGKAKVTFYYVRNSLANVSIYFRTGCCQYSSMIQIYRELDVYVKQKYQAKVDTIGDEHELWNKNIYDTAKKICAEFDKTTLVAHSNSFGSDIYRTSKLKFADSRSILVSLAMYPSTPTTCQAQIGLDIYNYVTLELMGAVPSKGYPTVIERRDNVINLIEKNGVNVIKAKLNGILDNQEFIFDTGASDVTITPDVFLILYKAGTIKESDFIGTTTYQLADGSKIKSQKFILKEMKIGDISLNEIEVSVTNNVSAPMLFGQSAIKRLGNYRIDFNARLLILN